MLMINPYQGYYEEIQSKYASPFASPYDCPQDPYSQHAMMNCQPNMLNMAQANQSLLNSQNAYQQNALMNVCGGSGGSGGSSHIRHIVALAIDPTASFDRRGKELSPIVLNAFLRNCRALSLPRQDIQTAYDRLIGLVSGNELQDEAFAKVREVSKEMEDESFARKVRRTLEEEEALELYEYKRHLQDIQDELARIERATPFPIRIWRRFWNYILTTRIMFAFGRYLLSIGENTP